jgi:hypothetical protein
VGLWLTVGIGVGVGVGLGEGVKLAVGSTVGVAEGSTDGSIVGLAVDVGVADGSTEPLGDGVAVGLGTTGEPLFCGSGTDCTMKSSRLSSVSCVDPAEPPGSRSRLLPAAGAAAGLVSSQALVALPQPTASIGVGAAIARRATLPPVAANPLA